MPRYKLRTLLIVLAIGPMVVAVAWLIWRDASMQRSFPVSTGVSYCVTAEFSELPDDDTALENWLHDYPGMLGMGVKRNGTTVEVIWGTSGALAEKLGDRPTLDLRAEFERLGYKGLIRFEPN